MLAPAPLVIDAATMLVLVPRPATIRIAALMPRARSYGSVGHG